MDPGPIQAHMVDAFGCCVLLISPKKDTTLIKSLTLTAAAPPNKHVSCSPGSYLVTGSSQKAEEEQGPGISKVIAKHVV